jgi:hypothetical protein
MLISFDYRPFIAIIGDIRGSKSLPARNTVQRRLQQVLNTVNRRHQNDIASNFMITLGDEFQGLLKSGVSCMNIIDRIEREMFPVRFRFGIGVGEMATDIPSTAFGADGPAYYLARDMIADLKTSEKEKKEPKKNIEIMIQGNPELSKLINTIFSLLSVIKENRTSRQIEIINAYMKGNGTQADAAKMLNINQSNVQRALASANYYTYRNALDIIAALMSEIREDAHG